MCVLNPQIDGLTERLATLSSEKSKAEHALQKLKKKTPTVDPLTRLAGLEQKLAQAEVRCDVLQTENEVSYIVCINYHAGITLHMGLIGCILICVDVEGGCLQ